MPDELKPTIVTVTGTTGTGSGIVESGKAPIYLHVVTPIMVIGVRAGKAYFGTLLGLLSAKMVAPDAIPATEFADVLLWAAGLSVASAGVSVVMSLVELFTKLDQKYPSLSV